MTDVRDTLPHPARIAAVVPESADTRTFVLALAPPVPAFDAARPGQFAMLSVLGHGEAAFTLSGLPAVGTAAGAVVVTVRRVGRLTGALFALGPGAMVGVRGPFGRGFPADPAPPTLYVGGGCGLSPLKAAVDHQLAARPPGTRVAILYGAREPATRIHRGVLAAWAETPGVCVLECVERRSAGWRGRVGLLTDLVDEAVASIGARRAAVCGPAAMLPAVGERLCRAGIDAADVHVAMERYMKCGTGHCGHCYVNHRYVCRDGPVFSWAELRGLPDAFAAERFAAAS